jgi:hypothetical protein
MKHLQSRAFSNYIVSKNLDSMFGNDEPHCLMSPPMDSFSSIDFGPSLKGPVLIFAVLVRQEPWELHQYVCVRQDLPSMETEV